MTHSPSRNNNNNNNNSFYRKQASSDEPSAFRLNQAAPKYPLDSSFLELSFNNHNASTEAPPASTSSPSLTSSPAPRPTNNNNIHSTPQSQSHSHTQSYSNSISWLPSTDLESKAFNAHHFLQRVLSHRFENNNNHTPIKSKDIQQQPIKSFNENESSFTDLNSQQHQQHVRDDSLDADAALAALDTVESALRRRRDAAVRDEQSARDDLRSALNASAQRRDLLLRSANTISSNVSNLSSSGHDVSSSLRNDLSVLKETSSKLSDLQDARDLITLLLHSSSSCSSNNNNSINLDNDIELDAVRVSRLLAKARTLLDDGEMQGIMKETEISKAKTEIAKYEKELATNVFQCMKRALNGEESENNGNTKNKKKKYTRLIAECATAAEHLGVAEKFVESYIEHVFSFHDHDNNFGIVDDFERIDNIGFRNNDIIFDEERNNIDNFATISERSSRKPGWRTAERASALSITSHPSLRSFRKACSSAVSIVRAHAAVIIESFSDHHQPLFTMLKMVITKKVLSVSNSTLSSMINSIHQIEQRLQQLKSSSNEEALVAAAELSSNTSSRNSAIQGQSSLTSRTAPAERFRNLSISDSKEVWREQMQRLSDEQRRYLNVSAEIFISLSKLKTDLYHACRNAGSKRKIEDFKNMLEESLNEVKASNSEGDLYSDSIHQHLVQYLDLQKTWMDDQLGAAFSDIARIDMHAPRLAPRERSNSEVYHRYRAFYGHVSSSFHQMTQRAIQSANECIRRTVSVLSSIRISKDRQKEGAVPWKNSNGVNENEIVDRAAMTIGRNRRVLDKRKDDMDVLKRQFSGYKEEELIEQKKFSASVHHSSISSTPTQSPRTISEMRMVIYDLTDNLVMNYVANVETLLQAATHLLPVCEEDARIAQLWMSGASPLTAYIQAIELLSKSNLLIHDFITNLRMTPEQSQPQHSHNDDDYGIPSIRSLMSTKTSASMTEFTSEGFDDAITVASEKEMLRFIPIELRELQKRELTSGLSDLSIEAQVGVQAAISSLRVRLFSMFTTKEATGVYTNEINEGYSSASGAILSSIWKFEKDGKTTDAIIDSDNSRQKNGDGAENNTNLVKDEMKRRVGSPFTESTSKYDISFEDMAHVDMHIEPSAAFISVSTFVEQQLLSVVSSMSSVNKEAVITEIGRVTREAVLHCWCNIDGIVTVNGALQMIEDGKTIVQIFHDHLAVKKSLQYLPILGQLFLQAAEDLWCFVESGGLSDVDARDIITLLKKRDDFESERVSKVCQSLDL